MKKKRGSEAPHARTPEGALPPEYLTDREPEEHDIAAEAEIAEAVEQERKEYE